jgi:hypothetical protein
MIPLKPSSAAFYCVESKLRLFCPPSPSPREEGLEKEFIRTNGKLPKVLSLRLMAPL